VTHIKIISQFPTSVAAHQAEVRGPLVGRGPQVENRCHRRLLLRVAYQCRRYSGSPIKYRLDELRPRLDEICLIFGFMRGSFNPAILGSAALVFNRRRAEQLRTDDSHYSITRPKRRRFGLLRPTCVLCNPSIIFSFPGETDCLSYETSSSIHSE